VAGGNAFGSVITAFFRSPGQSQVRAAGSLGIARPRIAFAVSTFRRRFCTTASTETLA
jgi:hypothetical protein